ncbi:MAG: hypothetical protein ACYC6Y_27450, partial [Thermoguttaceae bacterium]
TAKLDAANSRESMSVADTPTALEARPAPASAVRTGAAVEIRQVTTRRLLDAFVRFPWEIYAQDAVWVPPLIHDVKEFLNPRKHPFFQHGEAAKFLAFRQGEPVGRILVSDDPLRVAEMGENRGCFGMFESVDSVAVARSLLDTAAEWLRGRGRSGMLGPIDYSNNYPCGLLIDGFDTPPRYMMNHHPPYYGGLMTSCGLEKSTDLYAWWFDDAYDILGKWRRLAERAARRDAVTIRTFRRNDFQNEVRRCQQVYHGAQKDSWQYTRLTEAEFQYMARRMAQFGISDQVLLAEVEGKPVGFSITLPDINEAIKPLNGRLTRLGLPVGLARLASGLRRIKTARMLVLCVLDGYRHRGIGELLVLNTLEYGKHTIGYTGAELGWTVEGNDAIDRVIERVGGTRYKTYRVYEKSLA